jgi:hypothetical protein
MIVASSVMGRQLDWEYKTFRKRAETYYGDGIGHCFDITKEIFFPLKQVDRNERPLSFFPVMD